MNDTVLTADEHQLRLFSSAEKQEALAPTPGIKPSTQPFLEPKYT